jgi:hypothetical protein
LKECNENINTIILPKNNTDNILTNEYFLKVKKSLIDKKALDSISSENFNSTNNKKITVGDQKELTVNNLKVISQLYYSYHNVNFLLPQEKDIISIIDDFHRKFHLDDLHLKLINFRNFYVSLKKFSFEEFKNYCISIGIFWKTITNYYKTITVNCIICNQSYKKDESFKSSSISLADSTYTIIKNTYIDENPFPNYSNIYLERIFTNISFAKK